MKEFHLLAHVGYCKMVSSVPVIYLQGIIFNHKYKMYMGISNVDRV